MATHIDNVFKVKLVASNKLQKVVRDTKYAVTESVIFDVTPDVIENRNVNYKTLDPIHMPGAIYIYGSTSSRTFNISNAKFVSRTKDEATANMKKIHLLRSWAMPYFGKSNDVTSDGIDLLGAPPEVLRLYAYSSNSQGSSTMNTPMNIHNIPVVIMNLSIPYPSDVDYIQTNDNIPFPTVMTVDIQLTETHSPSSYSSFSLKDFKNGTLDGF